MTFDGFDRRGVVAAFATLALLCGCSGEGYATSSVTGTVTYKGKPVSGVALGLAPLDGMKLKRPPAFGVTGSDGRYTVVRPGNKTGAVAGPCTVRFSRAEGVPTNLPAGVPLDRVVEIDVKPGTSVHDFELGQ